MKKLLIGISALLMISAIFNAYLITKINKTRNELSKAKISDYFDKKRECAKLTSQIKAEIEKQCSGLFGCLLGTNVFEVIFYSHKDNSCLYATHYLHNDGTREYFVYNALTESKITSFKFPSQFEEYKKFILEYSNGEIRL